MIILNQPTSIIKLLKVSDSDTGLFISNSVNIIVQNMPEITGVYTLIIIYSHIIQYHMCTLLYNELTIAHHYCRVTL